MRSGSAGGEAGLATVVLATTAPDMPVVLKLEAVNIHGSAGIEQLVHAVEVFFLVENIVI